MEKEKKLLKLSASSMGTFEKCPKKYHYHYIEKPDIPKQDWSHLEIGKCVHRVLELFHQDLMKNIRQVEEYPQLMKTCFKQGLSEFDLEILKDELPNIKNILQSYLKRLNLDGLPEVIESEKEFSYQIQDYLVRGFIDRIDRVGPEEYRVIDYKTNKNPKYLNNFQLLLYALALQKIYPDAKKISGAYILLKHNCDKIEYQFTEKNYQETINKIIEIGTSIDTRTEWEKKPSVLCNWCDYQNICQGDWIS